MEDIEKLLEDKKITVEQMEKYLKDNEPEVPAEPEVPKEDLAKIEKAKLADVMGKFDKLIDKRINEALKKKAKAPPKGKVVKKGDKDYPIIGKHGVDV